MSLVDINDERQRWLWENTYTGNESATVEFWAYIFKEKIFRGPDFSIAPEAPPTTDLSNRRKVDLVIKKWQPARKGKKANFGAVLFFEAKKYKATQPEIETLESQAFTAALAWLQENDVVEAYSMTVIGDAAKLWFTTVKSDYPFPMVPTTSDLADRSSYIKANSTSAQDLRDGFDTILRYPQGLPESQIRVLKSNATPPKPAIGGDRYGITNPIQQPDFGTRLPQGISGGVSYSGYAPDTAIGETSFVPSVEASTQSTEADHNLALTSSGYSSLTSTSRGYDPPSSEFPSTNTNPTLESLEPLPDDAQYVEVKLRIDKENRYSYRYDYGDVRREAEGWQWQKRTKRYKGQVLECFLNTRQNGLRFWTWTLDPSVVQRVDSKHSKGKQRGH